MPDTSGILGGAAAGGLSGLKFGPSGALAGAALGAFGGLFETDPNKTPAGMAQNAIFKNVPNEINQGNAAVGSGLARLNQAGNFYSTILGGNQEQINNLLAPQVSTVMSQYDNAANQIHQFSPRGGGSTGTLAQLPFAKATAAANAWQGVLPGAAQGEANVGGATGSIGTGLISEANGVGSNAFNNVKMTNDLNAKLGAGIGQISASGAAPGANGASLPGFGGPVPGGSGGATPSAIPQIVAAGKGLGGWLAKILTKKTPGADGSINGIAPGLQLPPNRPTILNGQDGINSYRLPDGLINRTGNEMDGIPSLDNPGGF